MKLITWNCNMAFRKKASIILAHQPDIVVVPECESPKKLVFPGGVQQPNDVLWFGHNQNKGLGVFSYGKHRFELLDTYQPSLKLVAPVLVKNGRNYFIMLAVWANNPGDPDGTYVEQVWKALHHYDNHITKRKTILVGDFNSNTIWDRKRREGNHSNVVKKLADKGIVSCYHLHYKQEQGREQHPTHYLYRHLDKPYHLDYCFASKDIAKKIISVEVGDHAYWCKYSDHVPVMVTFK